MFQAFLLLSLSIPQSDDPIHVQAALGPRTEAGTRELRIDFQLAEGWSVPRFAMLPPADPAALLQLDPPPALAPVGKRPANLGEHLQMLFLDAPEERLLEIGTSSILFDTLSRPGSEGALEFNVVLYAIPPGSEGPAAARLLRRRYRLSPASAELESIASQPSSWGTGGFLQLGQQAASFELPTPYGDFRLSDALGKGFTVVTTHRSCL
jgi:hypothetical protein